MNEIKQNDIDLILSNHTYFTPNELSFWYNRLNKRIQELEPLLKELKERDLKLNTLSKKLATEVYNVKLLIILLDKYKLN